MDSNQNKNLDRFLGAILGAAVGDALGWPQEQNCKNVNRAIQKDQAMFQQWVRRDGYRAWAHEEVINPGEYSDDTQLIIATARSLRYSSNWGKYFTKIELPAWISYERGGGGATKRAAEAWKRGNSPWSLDKEKKIDVERYFNAGGNGVAMRILPHIFKNDSNFEEVMHQVFLNGIYTHGHPRALIGATLYADALMYFLNKKKTLGYGELVDYLLKRKDKWSKVPNVQKLDSWKKSADIIMKNKYMDIWNDVAEEVIKLLKVVKKGLDEGALDIGIEVLEELGCFDATINGSGTVTAVASIYLASKYASSPHLALLESAHLKNADTDTLASMVGGLLGMLHGSEFLSVSWLDIQDYEYLKRLIYSKPMIDEISNGPIFDYSKPDINSKLKQLNPGESITALPFGKLTLKDKVLNKSNAKGSVINKLKLVSEEGQSIFIKTYEKGLVGKESPVQDKTNNTFINQQIINEYNIEKNEIQGKEYKPVLDARKIRGLVNLLPENLSFDLCILFIADIMDEMERIGTGQLNRNSLNYLKEKWTKHKINIGSIERAIKAILYY